MDPVRFGLAVRALRRRRGWTQARLAAEANLSQAAISRIEVGHGNRQTVRLLTSVVAALGARISVRVLSHGEDLDRLLDAGHAAIVEHVTQLLRSRGWEVVPEATFNVYGDRGSIDVLAYHPATGALLVVEVKSVVPDVQATLSGIDRKARVAATVARDRGWRVTFVSRWLVVAGDRTSRRRIERHAETFRAALPAGTIELRRWAVSPAESIAGIMFVPRTTGALGRHRIRANGSQSGDRQHPGN